ncbi:MAG TPA: Gfo/Idh/MocA family oxidoreductase [Planctomycetota bacterium]|nr:Gfo/Idh/MocA family oxidoreductase [Planctomycetota bacterium]
MGPDPLRTAVVGCGRIGTWSRPEHAKALPPGWIPLSHADAIRSVPGLSLVALCDSNADNLGRALEAYPGTRPFSDYRALIDDVRPDILSIATRTAGRCDIIEYAARHGVRGIHLEKPISTNLADCTRALSAASAAGVQLSYGTTRRFMDIYAKARDLLASGEIGTLVEVQVQMGRNSLLWSHPHSVDLLIFYSGTSDVDVVHASSPVHPASWAPGLIDDDPVVEHALVRFKNGITGSISSAGGYNVLLCGTEGNLCIGGNGGWIDLRKKSAPEDLYFLDSRRVHVDPTASGTARAFHRLESAVRTGGPPPMPPEEIAANQRILIAMAASALDGGRPIAPAEVDPRFTVTGRFGDKYA